jgi:hypothetical protein
MTLLQGVPFLSDWPFPRVEHLLIYIVYHDVAAGPEALPAFFQPGNGAASPLP